MLEGIFYKIGERVKIKGLYVCVPCGYKKLFKKGDRFTACTNCMRISKPISEQSIARAQENNEEIDEFSESEDEFVPNLETWELLQERE